MTITSKYNGRCRECRKQIFKGDRVEWQRGQGVTCEECAMKFPNPKDQMEYDRGRADYDRYRFNRDTFGEDYAAAEEAAWELKDPDPYY